MVNACWAACPRDPPAAAASPAGRAGRRGEPGGIVVKIVHICAVYRTWPVLMVVQTDTGEFLERSLKELGEGEVEFADNAWKQLVEDYRVFHHSYQ